MHFSSFNQQISSLKGLEYAINLETLHISLSYSTDNIDISQLTKLPKLKTLELSGNTKNIDIIQNLTNLETLSIYASSDSQTIIDLISKLVNLKSLYITNTKITTLKPFESLTKLEYLSIYGYIKGVNNVEQLQSLRNLKGLTLVRSVDSTSEPIDYSHISTLLNLESLRIQDSYSTLDISYLNNTDKLNYLTLKVKDLINPNLIEKHTSLTDIYIESGKLTNANFVKKLNNLRSINLDNNLITDMTPFEGTTANTIYLRGNPINQNESNNARIIANLRSQNKFIELTDYDKMQNLEFKYPEFKNMLIKQYDVNMDNEICEYELEKINYLYLEGNFENAEYFKNLNSLNFNSMKLTKEEQLELIQEINKLKENTKVTFSSITINLGNIKQTSEKVEFNINEICPLIAEMQNKNSKLYVENFMFKNEDYYGNIGEIKDGKIIIPTDYTGEMQYYTSIINSKKPNEYITGLYINWQILIQGDSTKEIFIQDSNLKSAILENYDIDKDGKITENDILNLVNIELYDSGNCFFTRIRTC